MSTQIKPTPMGLFSASLEAHMAAYTEEIKQNLLNQEFQLAQNRIVREGQLYNLSQADLMNRLNALSKQLKNDLKPPTNIPLSKTNAPEVKVEEERYIPMTAAEYENKQRQPRANIANKRGVINELIEVLQKKRKTKLLNEILSKGNIKNKIEVNKLLDNVLDELINKGLKREEVLKGAENVVDNLFKQVSEENRKKQIKQFSKGYVSNLLNTSSSNTKSKTLSESPISSTSASTSSNIEGPESLGYSNFMQVRKQMKNTLNQSQYIQALQEMEKMRPEEKIPFMNKKISGGGLKKKKTKKKSTK
jgi:hypothetical protein